MEKYKRLLHCSMGQNKNSFEINPLFPTVAEEDWSLFYDDETQRPI